jgi:hypothetical protein
MSYNPVVYRTTDPTKWGTGLGSDLPAVTIDNNNWNLDSRVGLLEGTAIAKQIDYIAESNNALFVHYTDHTIDGPFPMPIATFNWRGSWLPSTAYNLYDVLSYANGIYLAVMAFTSGSTFATNDGAGHTWLQLMLRYPAVQTLTVTTATFQPDLTYANSYIRCTNVSGCTFTIPNDTTVTWAVDTEMHVRDCSSSGSVGVQFVAASGVILNGIEGRLLETDTTGAVVGMKHVAANEWDLWGLLEFA